MHLLREEGRRKTEESFGVPGACRNLGVDGGRCDLVVCGGTGVTKADRSSIGSILVVAWLFELRDQKCFDFCDRRKLKNPELVFFSTVDSVMDLTLYKSSSSEARK